MRFLIFVLVALAVLVAVVPAQASNHSCVEYQYYSAGYYGGRYYPAGYYPVERRKVVFIELFNLPVYSVGHDPNGGLKEEIQALRKEIQALRLNSQNNDSKSAAERILVNNCASCHTGEKAEKGFRIFTSPGALNPDLDWYKVWERSDDGTMPPKPRDPLSNEDVRVLKDRFKLSKKGG